MKPNTAHNDPERWRQNDAGLRRALQQRYANMPELPTGFEARMKARMAKELGEGEPKARRRRLWTRVTAAAAVVALVAGVAALWPTGNPQADMASLEADAPIPMAASTPTATAPATATASATATVPTAATVPAASAAGLTANSLKPQTSPHPRRVQPPPTVPTTIPASEESTDALTPATPLPLTATPSSEEETDALALNTPTTEVPRSAELSAEASETVEEATASSVDNARPSTLNDQLSSLIPAPHRGPRSGLRTGTSPSDLSLPPHSGPHRGPHRGLDPRPLPSSPLLAINTFIGTDGGTLNMGMSEMDEDKGSLTEQYASNDPSTPRISKPANYYFPMGNGYTYDFSHYGGGDDNDEKDGGDDGDDDTYDGSRKAPARASDLGPAKAPVIGSAKHRLPVTIGATVAWRLSERWSLETGLTYTQLTSTFDDGTVNNYEHREQHIHDLGIPVRAHAQLLERKRWSIYGAAGGSVELPVVTSLTTQQIIKDEVSAVAKGHVSAPVQFSLSLAAGVSYNITPAIGIYAEPSMQWFVPTNSAVETYRTEHPLRFIPQVGVRLQMNKERPHSPAPPEGGE